MSRRLGAALALVPGLALGVAAAGVLPGAAGPTARAAAGASGATDGASGPTGGGAASATAPAVRPTPVVTLKDPRLTESSGLVLSPTHAGIAWTVNDSGSGPEVFGVSLRTGDTRAVLRVRGVDFRDVEALTASTGSDGRGLVWIGDIGDNDRERASVVLRLVHEPRAVTSATVPAVSLRLRYPNGPVDAETLVWTPDGRLLIVTKDLLSADVLQVPPAAVRAALRGVSTEEPVVARRLATVPQGLVTDGAALPDGRIVLRGYGDAVVYSAPAKGDMEAVESFALPVQPQGETLAVESEGRSLLVGSEGERQPLLRVRLPAGSVGARSTTSVPAESPAPTTQRTTAETTPSVPTSRPPVLSAKRAIWWLLGGGVVAAAFTGARRRSRRRR